MDLPSFKMKYKKLLEDLVVNYSLHEEIVYGLYYGTFNENNKELSEEQAGEIVKQYKEDKLILTRIKKEGEICYIDLNCLRNT
jgi:hypothetical protein